MTRRIFWIVITGMVIIAALAVIRSFSGGNEVAGQHLAWGELAFTFPGMWDLGGLIGSVLWVGTDPRYTVRYWGVGMTLVSVTVAGAANGFQAYSQSIDVLKTQGWPVPAFVASFVVPVMYATLTHIAARCRVALKEENERLELEAKREVEEHEYVGNELAGGATYEVEEPVTKVNVPLEEYEALRERATVATYQPPYPRQETPTVQTEEPPFGSASVPTTVQLSGTAGFRSASDADLDRVSSFAETVQGPVEGSHTDPSNDVPEPVQPPVPEPVQPEPAPSIDPRMAPPRGPWEIEDDAPTVMLPITRTTARPITQPQPNPQPAEQPPPAAELPTDDDLIITRIVEAARASTPPKVMSVQKIKDTFDIAGTSRASRLQHKAKAELGI